MKADFERFRRAAAHAWCRGEPEVNLDLTLALQADPTKAAIGASGHARSSRRSRRRTQPRRRTWNVPRRALRPRPARRAQRSSRFDRSGRQPPGEGGPAAGCAFDRDLGAHHPGELATDRQPEPRAACRRSGRVVDFSGWLPGDLSDVQPLGRSRARKVEESWLIKANGSIPVSSA